MDNNRLFFVDEAHRLMLSQLRENHFTVTAIWHDHSETVDIVCEPRTGHDDPKPSIFGVGQSIQAAIEDAWINWMKTMNRKEINGEHN